MNFIKRWLWHRNAKKVVKEWFEDYDADRMHELFVCQRELAQARKALFADCEYVQYEGSGEYPPYKFSNAHLLAEHVMWDRIKMNYGNDFQSKGLEVKTYDVAHPYDSGMVWSWIAMGFEDHVKTRRIYFKVSKHAKDNFPV